MVLQLVFGLGLVVYCWIWMVWCLCLMPVELLVIVVVLFCYLLSCVGRDGFDLLFLGCLWCVVLVGLFWSCLFCWWCLLRRVCIALDGCSSGCWLWLFILCVICLVAVFDCLRVRCVDCFEFCIVL